ncbi:immunity 49 family protein [Streptomyces nojiriensis]
MAHRVDDLEVSAHAIDFAFSTAVLALQAHCVADPEADTLETWHATVTAIQLGSALFAVTGTSEGTVGCFINGRTRTLEAIGPQSYADAGNWLLAFWLAVICREQRRITELCEIPLDRLRSADGSYEEFYYHWVDAQQSYCLRRPGLADELTAAIEASSPEVAHTLPRDVLQGLLYPPINLLHALVRNNADGFGPALAEALALHKGYWTLTDERAEDIDGAVALGPLAMACLAYDAKLPIGVDSPLIPKYLLEHGWLGEFPT